MIYGRYVTIRFSSNTQDYLQLCEVQIMARTNQTDCKQTGLACTAAKPQELTMPSGLIASPTMYNVGKYPPNADCRWQITVSSNKVSPWPKVNFVYRLRTVNSNTVNSKFHLIRSYCEYLARILSFHV